MRWRSSHWTRDVTAGFPPPAISNQRSRGASVRDELTIARSTRLSAGLRAQPVRQSATVSAYGVDDRQRARELGVLRPFGGGVSVCARLGRSVRLPNVDAFNDTRPHVRCRARTSNVVEAGACSIDGERRLEGRLYRSNLTDEIGFDPVAVGPFGPFGANLNLAQTRRQGVELELTRPLAGSFRLRLSAALRRATFRATFCAGTCAGSDVPLTPRRSLARRGEWLPTANQQVDVMQNHVGVQRPDFANACHMPSYTALDLRYADRRGRLEFAAGLTDAARAGTARWRSIAQRAWSSRSVRKPAAAGRRRCAATSGRRT